MQDIVSVPGRWHCVVMDDLLVCKSALKNGRLIRCRPLRKPEYFCNLRSITLILFLLTAPTQPPIQ